MTKSQRYIWPFLLSILGIAAVSPLSSALLTNRTCAHTPSLPPIAEDLIEGLSVVKGSNESFKENENSILPPRMRCPSNLFQAGKFLPSLAALKPPPVNLTLRKCLCLTIFLGVLHLFFGMYLSNHEIVHRVIEASEQRIKYSFIHNLQNEGPLQEAITLKNNEARDRKIFFLHIPRTSGCAISTDLFGVDRTWISDHSTYRSAPFNINEKKNIYKKWGNSSIIVIRGFFGYNDIAEYKGPGHESKKIFTILRHPLERIFSLYKRLQKASKKCNNYSRDQHVSRWAGCLTLSEFLHEKDVRIQALISNYATFALGSRAFRAEKVFDFTNTSLLEEQYRLAKKHLEELDFIGFYENLWVDFEQLHHTIFPDVEGTGFTRAIYNTGTFFGTPRMRTLKYSSNHPNKSDIDQIMDKNRYDLMLYDYARRYTKKGFKLYPDYKSYLLDQAIPLTRS